MLVKIGWGAGRKCQLLEQNPEKKITHTVTGNMLGSVLKCWKSTHSESPVCLSVLCCLQEESENIFSQAILLDLIINFFV